MEKIKNLLAVYIKRITLCFTATVMCFVIIGTITNVEKVGKGLAISQLTDLFLFSLLLGVAFGVSDFIKKNVVLRRTMQFVLTYACFALIFFTGGTFKDYFSQMQNPAFSLLAVSFMFVVIYVFVALILLFARFIENKFENKSKEYVSMFDEQKKN